jgi:hypothetical protein
MPGLKPFPEFEAGGIRGVGTRETAGDEAESFGFRPYCFL